MLLMLHGPSHALVSALFLLIFWKGLHLYDVMSGSMPS